jgi:hypothetical protein
MLAGLARTLGVERALRVLGRVMVDDLMLYPLRGAPIQPDDWRARWALRRFGLRPWLTWAAQHTQRRAAHVTVTRPLVWRRFLLADAPRTGQLVRDLVAPPREYLEWLTAAKTSEGKAWRSHLASALRSSGARRSP